MLESRMKELREEKGLTQTELARAVTEAGFKIAPAAINRWESTGHGIGYRGRLVLAEVLGCNPMELV